MHELTVTENILEIASRHGKQAHATRVTDIYIVIGRLSSIVDDSVQFYWDIISGETLCKGARLHFDRRPAKLNCKNCGETYILEDQLSPCPKCSGLDVQVIAGEEFWVDSIEIEKEG